MCIQRRNDCLNKDLSFYIRLSSCRGLFIVIFIALTFLMQVWRYTHVRTKNDLLVALPICISSSSCDVCTALSYVHVYLLLLIFGYSRALDSHCIIHIHFLIFEMYFFTVADCWFSVIMFSFIMPCGCVHLHVSFLTCIKNVNFTVVKLKGKVISSSFFYQYWSVMCYCMLIAFYYW